MGFKFVNDVDWRSARDEGGSGSIVLQKVVEVTRHGHSTRSTSRKKASPIRITKLGGGGRELSAAAGADSEGRSWSTVQKSVCQQVHGSIEESGGGTLSRMPATPASDS